MKRKLYDSDRRTERPDNKLLSIKDAPAYSLLLEMPFFLGLPTHLHNHLKYREVEREGGQLRSRCISD